MEQATEKRQMPRIAGADKSDCKCDLCSTSRRLRFLDVIEKAAAPRMAQPLTDDQLWGV